MFGRIRRRVVSGSFVMSTQPRFRSWNNTCPEVGSKARSTIRLVVVLPQPDSPTSPRVLPFGIVKLTPSTARTCPITFLKKPCVIGNSLARSRTSSRLLSVGGLTSGSSREGAGRDAGLTLIVGPQEVQSHGAQ